MLRLSLLALAASVVVAKGPTVTTKVFFDVVSFFFPQLVHASGRVLALRRAASALPPRNRRGRCLPRAAAPGRCPARGPRSRLAGAPERGRL